MSRAPAAPRASALPPDRKQETSGPLPLREQVRVRGWCPPPRLIIWLQILTVLLPLPATAHRLKLFAAVEGGSIVGTAYYTGGGKPAGVTVTVTGPQAEQRQETRTDAAGAFRIVPFGPVEHRISVDTGDGHRAEFVIAAAELAPGPLPLAAPLAPAAAATPISPAAAALPSDLLAAIDQAVARQVLPLRQALDASESRIRLADIVGGIGLILGVFGAAALVTARRRAGRQP